MVRCIFIILFSGFLVLGCSRPVSEDVSKITIEVPKKLESVGSLSALPTNRKACFGVSVTGPGIPISQNSCAPRTGVLAGFAEAGQSIEALVPRGSDRKIELFVFLLPEGQNSTCPKLTATFPAVQLLNTYLVAEKSGLELSAPVVSVDITMQFPGLTQNLIKQMNLSPSCAVADKVPTGIGANAGRFRGLTMTRGYTVDVRIAEPGVKNISGSPGGYKLRTRN